MQKVIYTHKQALGSNGQASATLGTQDQDLVIEGAVQYRKPVKEILDPAFGAIDSFIDKIEQWIPGDQKEEAAKLKVEVREMAAKALIGAVPEATPAIEAPASV